MTRNCLSSKVPPGYSFVRCISGKDGRYVSIIRALDNFNFYVQKTYLKTLFIDAEVKKHFFDEVNIQKSVNHINILSVNAIYEDETNVYLIMDYCSNGDLYNYILKNGRFLEIPAINVFKQIVEGLNYLHEKGISHRDLKLENILITANGVIKIADFGVSHTFKENALLKTPCGSPFYAPPEVILNKEYDGRSRDIWSLGIILFVMVTGYLPWTNTTKANLFNEIVTCNYVIPEELPPNLRNLLGQLLSREPSKRPSTEMILKHPWTNFMASESSSKGSIFTPAKSYKAPPPKEKGVYRWRFSRRGKITKPQVSVDRN